MPSGANLLIEDYVLGTDTTRLKATNLVENVLAIGRIAAGVMLDFD
jgi:hypothetical protein